MQELILSSREFLSSRFLFAEHEGEKKEFSFSHIREIGGNQVFYAVDPVNQRVPVQMQLVGSIGVIAGKEQEPVQGVGIKGMICLIVFDQEHGIGMQQRLQFFVAKAMLSDVVHSRFPHGFSLDIFPESF